MRKRYVIKWARISPEGTRPQPELYLRLATTWRDTRTREEVPMWGYEMERATPFGSEADAWAAFDKHELGAREDYDVVPLSHE